MPVTRSPLTKSILCFIYLKNKNLDDIQDNIILPLKILLTEASAKNCFFLTDCCASVIIFCKHTSLCGLKAFQPPDTLDSCLSLDSAKGLKSFMGNMSWRLVEKQKATTTKVLWISSVYYSMESRGDKHAGQ